jgi:valyl-tRNA synthetase
VFVDLYNKGLIYRGARMIHWDPAAKTALSDEEVEHRDVESTLYYIQYAVAGSDEYLVIATQRPETIMGDTAVCVNPNDERYRHLKGAKVVVPLVNREVPIIFDEYVDPAFGTGALKITPAHDINDYNLGLKHNLPTIDTLNEDGTLSEAAEVFVGIDRFEARKKVIEQLQALHQIERAEAYQTRLGFSQRSNAVVEPRISTQWFVKMPALADKALTAVTSGAVSIHPEERFLATYTYWLQNIKDWCISRQLWWGQRIPAWYDADGRFVVAEDEEKAKALFRATFHTPDPVLKQDEDVLDTWFSSWLWPVEVFHGITKPGNPEINYYYPTSVLVTGQDIIFFWVARMIMAGLEYKEQEPFRDVYFTGMVRDKQGRKMSKSLGNSPDLLHLIDRFGADAVRFGIMIAAPAGNDLLFDESSCDQGRSFNNKIWNALKLVKMWEAGLSNEPDEELFQKSMFAATWFEARLQQATAEIEALYKEFKLSEALKTIYSLIWDDFCSWYLEWVKPAYGQPLPRKLFDATNGFFEQLLHLLHPFMPFVTEEIYHHLRERSAGDDLAIRQWRAAEANFFKTSYGNTGAVLQLGEHLKNSITAVRDARIKNSLKPKEDIELYLQTENEDGFKNIEPLLSKAVNASAIRFTNEMPPHAITVVVGKDKFYIHSQAPVDTAAQREQLQKEVEYLKGFLLSVEKKLSNERFVQNAKPEVVEIERRKKADAEEKIKGLEESLKVLA